MESLLKGISMKLHTRILTVLADDIAAFNAEDITIVLSPHFGMCREDFDELKTIMAERDPTIRLRYFLGNQGLGNQGLTFDTPRHSVPY
jgi:hypothetical protein